MNITASALLCLVLTAAPFQVWPLNTMESHAGDTTYVFELDLGAAGHWDPMRENHPPLSPGKAVQIASDFMQMIPFAKNLFLGWKLEQISLRKIGEPDQWIYNVSFHAEPAGDWNGPIPSFIVPVTMNGTVAKRTLKRDGAKN